ncbi:MAG TPA: beta-glucosidase, partial [Flavobacterium sp.]
MKKGIVLPALILLIGTQTYAQKKWTETPKGTYTIVQNKGGQTLGYSSKSGVKILEVNGFAFKDLNKNGSLDSYEDWRKPVAERAKDLAAKMTVEQISGLMLYSRHQSVPAQEAGMFTGTYNDKPFSKSGAKSSDLSDQQIAFLT